jgi:hypothetical protein
VPRRRPAQPEARRRALRHRGHHLLLEVNALLDRAVVDARVATWIADGVALARDAELCWLVRQAALELAVCALARLARGARTQRGERAFANAWRAVEGDVRALLLTAPSATGAKRPATMQSAVASAIGDAERIIADASRSKAELSALKTAVDAAIAAKQ